MSQFEIKDYYKEAFNYCLHHVGYKDSVPILDKNFSMTDVSVMAERYLFQFSSSEEKKAFNIIRKMEEIDYYNLIMRVKDRPIDDVVKYLKDRNIRVSYINTILKKVEENKKFMLEEYQYLQDVIETMKLWDKNGGKKLSDEDKLKLEKEKQYKENRINNAKEFLKGFLAEDNPVPIFQQYCAFHNLSSRAVKSDIELLRTCSPDLYHQFLGVYAKRNSEEYKKKFLHYVDSILEKVSEIILQAKEEGRRPDLVDYYGSISIPYPALLKVISAYYTKKENDLLRNIRYTVLGFNHPKYNGQPIFDGLSINGVYFTREEQNQVLQWLQDNNLPITQKVFLDKMRRLSAEKKRNESNDSPKQLLKK